MKKHSIIQTAIFSIAIILGILGNAFAGAAIPQNANEALVLKAMMELFEKRNTGVLREIWADDYKQHNPGIANGRDHLKRVIEALPVNFTYEPGFITSNADIVMIHGKYSGLGLRPLVLVDIFRVKGGGRLVEHWDVTQEEVQA